MGGVSRHINISIRTHIENMKDPGEVLLPSGDCIFIGFCVKEARGEIPFTLLGDLLLDLGHSSTIENLVRESPDVRIAWLTHAVNCFIASSTD